MKTNDKDIVYGGIEISEKDFDISKVKVRVNTWIDGDIVQELKKRAKLNNTKYQTLLNSLLREVVFKKEVSMSEILERLDQLESKVG
tara:strand:+ start:4230 stop:4490 length:261 start_codon:yes stop_codon:yes gene_type:complete